MLWQNVQCNVLSKGFSLNPPYLSNLRNNSSPSNLHIPLKFRPTFEITFNILKNRSQLFKIFISYSQFPKSLSANHLKFGSNIMRLNFPVTFSNKSPLKKFFSDTHTIQLRTFYACPNRV